MGTSGGERICGMIVEKAQAGELGQDEAQGEIEAERKQRH